MSRQVTQAWFRGGCLHGLARRTELRRFRTFRQHVTWLGRYRGGVARGRCWAWREGGGWLTGSVDREGAFSGDNIAFLYPDLRCRTSHLNYKLLASVHLRPLYTWPLYT